MKHQGKSVVISGGTSGINLGIAKTLAAEGANVCVFGRDPEKAARAANEISSVAAGGGKSLGCSADVRVPDSVGEVFEKAHSEFGAVDIVIAGAAGNFLSSAADLSPKGFKTVIDIDLLGAYNVFHHAFHHISKPGGSMIAITAPQAVNPTGFQVHACAAKAGINMLVKCLALEWGQFGIRVNAISPGPIADTEGMARLAPTPEIEKAMTARTPLKRFGTKDEIGALASFLSAQEAEYITGSIFNCDGGVELGDASADFSPRK